MVLNCCISWACWESPEDGSTDSLLGATAGTLSGSSMRLRRYFFSSTVPLWNNLFTITNILQSSTHANFSTHVAERGPGQNIKIHCNLLKTHHFVVKFYSLLKWFKYICYIYTLFAYSYSGKKTYKRYAYSYPGENLIRSIHTLEKTLWEVKFLVEGAAVFTLWRSK